MKDNGKEPLVILAGPTAAGKTALSVRLAKAIGGEIISADSMQVYRRMDIGTAKIRPEEMGGVPHHMLDIIEPEENFNVADFCGAASAAAEQICARGHIPVLVGGTGFYIQALRKGVDFGQGESSPAYRKRLEEIAAAGGAEQLYRQLGEIDRHREPRSAIATTTRGTYLLAVVDGRQQSSHGCTLTEWAQLLKAFGAKDALNLDGGGSSELVAGGQVLNSPSDGRERGVGSAIVVLHK